MTTKFYTTKDLGLMGKTSNRHVAKYLAEQGVKPRLTRTGLKNTYHLWGADAAKAIKELRAGIDQRNAEREAKNAAAHAAAVAESERVLAEVRARKQDDAPQAATAEDEKVYAAMAERVAPVTADHTAERLTAIEQKLDMVLDHLSALAAPKPEANGLANGLANGHTPCPDLPDLYAFLQDASVSAGLTDD